MTWDPTHYLRYEGHRIRPAVELLQRVVVEPVERVIDLGCGTGNTTLLLADRWPDAEVSGLDNSAEMLGQARRDHPDLEWTTADIATWAPERPSDVVYSNAALHWVDNHDELFPRLLAATRPGGVLAVQMPRNFDEPTHTLVTETVIDGPWRNVLEPLLRRRPVEPAAEYVRLLGPVAAEVDAWETTYLQVLSGKNPVAEWTKGSVLRPLLGALDEAAGAAFFSAYAERIAVAYPAEVDGTTILPFTRVFVVARR